MELLSERKHAKLYEDSPLIYYEVKQPNISEKEQEFVNSITKISTKNYSTEELQEIFVKDKKKEKLIEKVNLLFESLKPYSEKMITIEEEPEVFSIVSDFINKNADFIKNKEDVIEQIVSNLFGLNKIGILLEDDELEEVMINGANQPVYVFDRAHGLCRTNVSFNSKDEIIAMIKRISNFVAKEINEDNPLLDARLPDGSRINATIPPASPHNPSITIRKFRKRPITITEMIKNNTITAETAAFLWVCVDGMQVSPMNMIIAGGTGSGKTTTLNALSVFIPERERIVTIEDTLEINLFTHSNWVQLESRPGIMQKSIELDDLLKNAIRMRPDRILVGEVRGKEASTMFTAMDIGHQGLISTLHANSARETILRLQSKPMNVAPSMFTLLDLVVMQHRMYWPRKGLIRRVAQISEVSVMGEHVLINDLFVFNREKDTIEKTSLPSAIVEKFAFLTGLKINEVRDEIELRKNILQALVDKKTFDYNEIKKTIVEYNENPTKLVKKLGLK